MVEHLYVKFGDRYLRYLVKNRQTEVKNHLHPPAAVSVCNRGENPIVLLSFLDQQSNSCAKGCCSLDDTLTPVLRTTFATRT